MPPKRRAADRPAIRAIGIIACLVLAGSLTYTFFRTLFGGTDQVDPLFFGLQAAASFFFLIYSVWLRNRIFVAANAVALLNAAGTLLLIVIA